MPRTTVLRDRIARFVSSELERERAALRLVARDRGLPLAVRLRANTELAASAARFPRHSAPVAIHNRCSESGKSRGLISAFKLSKIVFREKALAGELPGVRKSLW
ncbi:40S ribosomal protein mrp2, mitochondrial [Cladochytrium tenue]|nr:40S ribosomal protein mrp2, mitochondrial [Cladochytrium tenue]